MYALRSRWKWAAMGALVLMTIDMSLISVQVRHPIDPWPWGQLLYQWSALVLGCTLLQAGTEYWVPMRSRHWSVTCLSIVAGSAVGASYIPSLHGGLVGGAIGLLFGLLVPRRMTPAAVVGLTLIWTGTTLIKKGSSPDITEDTINRPDIVLVTIDTVREDALSSSPRALIPALTPTLDRLAGMGCQHHEATAPSPLTGPSHAAMLSGAHPLELGLFKNGATLPKNIPWMPEILHRQGYQTAAFVSSAMLDGSLGYQRGFHTYDDDQSGMAAMSHSTLSHIFPVPTVSKSDSFSRYGGETIERMTQWLSDVDPDRPVFIWLHLYDAHRPYVATSDSMRFVEEATVRLPEPSSFSQWTPPDDTPPVTSIGTKIFDDLMQTAMNTSLKPGPETMPLMYLAGVRDLDGLVGKAWTSIDTLRPDSDRIWAILGDHGESLTEHGELGSHQHNVYEANLRVPFLLSDGDCPTGPRSTVEVAGILLKRAKIDESWPTGLPLEAAVRVGKRAPTHPSMFKLSRRVGDQKVVVGIDDEQTMFTESYELSVDPHEQRPLSRTPTSLGHFAQEATPKLTDRPEQHSTDASVHEALRALGYIE